MNAVETALTIALLVLSFITVGAIVALAFI